MKKDFELVDITRLAKIKLLKIIRRALGLEGVEPILDFRSKELTYIHTGKLIINQFFSMQQTLGTEYQLDKPWRV